MRLAFNRWMRATQLWIFLLLFVGGRARRSWVEENFDFRALHAFGESIHGGRASVLLSAFAISYSSLSGCFGTHVLRHFRHHEREWLISFCLYFTGTAASGISTRGVFLFLLFLPFCLAIAFFIILTFWQARLFGRMDGAAFTSERNSY